MTRHCIAIAIALVSFVTLVPTPAAAQILKVAASLDGSQIVPNNVITGAHGTVELSIDLSTATVSWTVTLVNLPSGILALDIHVGGAGLNGPEIFTIQSPTFASNDVQYTGSKSISTATLQPNLGLRSLTDVAQTIAGGDTYALVHTEANPAGDIRGQFSRVQ